MAILASKISAGGLVGDTFGNLVIAKVYSDTVYSWVDSDSAAPGATVANIAAMPLVADQAEGFTVKVSTNGLTYIVEGGVYVITDYQITVADVTARDALTEMETGQRVYLEAEDRVDRWDGTMWVEGFSPAMRVDLHADLPDPTTVKSGVEYIVLNDPISGLNGKHIALGGNNGAMGAYWEQL